MADVDRNPLPPPSADLVGVLAQPRPQVPSFRQGVVIAWNPTTGENTVELEGVQLTDLGFVGAGSGTAVPAYDPGDTVLLLVVRQTVVVLGLVLDPPV